MSNTPTDAELKKLAEECGIGWAAGLGGMDDFLRAFSSAVLAKWGQSAQAAEPVAWLRNTTDPQPHAVTNLKYRSAVDAKAGVEYIPVFAAPQPTQARADGWTPGHEKLYVQHVLETGGVGDVDDLRTFIDKQMAANGGNK